MGIIENEGFASETNQEMNGKFRSSMKYTDSVRIRGQYLSRADAIKLPDGRKFKGMKFSVDEFEQIIGSGTDKATEIYIALGFHNGRPKPEFQGVTMIAHAIGQNNIMIKDDSRIFDYSIACPDNCPTE